MPSWPADLPQEFESDGFSDELEDQLIRPAGAGGTRTSRRRAERGERYPVAGRMLMTTTQWEALLEFYGTDLADGALEFDFPDPDDGTETIAVAFTAPPDFATIGGSLHAISLSFERVF